MRDDPARKAEEPREDPPLASTGDVAETLPPTPSAGSPASPESWDLPGGRYHVVGEIARGGMGVVLRAVDADLQRPLAVKVMLARGGREAEDRFLEEARITGQLQHPGIPPVHDIGRLADGRPFFSMKLIEGQTLTELLRDRETPQTDLPRFLKVKALLDEGAVGRPLVITISFRHGPPAIDRNNLPWRYRPDSRGVTKRRRSSSSLSASR